MNKKKKNVYLNAINCDKIQGYENLNTTQYKQYENGYNPQNKNNK